MALRLASAVSMSILSLAMLAVLAAEYLAVCVYRDQKKQVQLCRSGRTGLSIGVWTDGDGDPVLG